MHREARIANYVLAAFVIVSLTLLSLPLSTPVLIFKTCASYVLNPIAFYGEKGAQRLAGIPPSVRDLLAADVENRQMREDVRRSAWIAAEAATLRAENQRLRSELGLKPQGARSALWAHILERDPQHWYRSVMIDAGAEQGVTLNAPALGRRGEGLAAVGRVVEVRPRSAMVLLLTDELSSAAAYLSSTTLEGLVQGQGSSRLLMNYLSSEENLEAGELVYTSPTSATFPGEILIGRVSKVFPRDPFLTFQSVEVEPAVEASALKEILILTKPGAAVKAVVAAKAAPEPEPEDPPAAETDE